nr:hypothetical protein GCM10023233_18780 [Brevibacterium otitidis]
MQRVAVVGSSGSGKTTVARQLAKILGAPYVELDAVHWKPNWTPADPAEIRRRVQQEVAHDTWVIDGNYQSIVGSLIWDRADTVVWVNPSRVRSTWRVIRRTIRRARSREELWNGNRESWSGLFFWRGEESIVWWAWHAHPVRQSRYEAAMNNPKNAHLTFHRLRTPGHVRQFLTAAEHRA